MENMAFFIFFNRFKDNLIPNYYLCTLKNGG